MEPIYLSIEPEKTGKKIKKLLDASGYSVRDVQSLMGFNNPQAIYKWLAGKSIPNIDNLVILSRLLLTTGDNRQWGVRLKPPIQSDQKDQCISRSFLLSTFPWQRIKLSGR